MKNKILKKLTEKKFINNSMFSIVILITLAFVLSLSLCIVLNISKRIIFVFMFIFYILFSFLLKENKIKTSKNISFAIIISFFISLFVFGSFSNNFLYSNNYITITPDTQKNDLSNSHEIWLCSAFDKYKSTELNKLLPSKEWIIQNGCIIYIGNSQTPLIIPSNSNETLNLSFNKHNFSGMMTISYDGVENNYDLYSEKSDNLNLSFGVINNHTVSTNLWFQSLLIILAITILNFAFINYSHKEKIYLLFPVLLILSTIGIILHVNKYIFVSSIIIFMILSYFSYFFIKENRTKFSKWNALLFILITFINSFLVCGANLFLSSPSIAFDFSFQAFSLYILTTLLVVIFELSTLYLFNFIEKSIIKKASQKKSRFWLYFTITFSVLLLWAIAFYPANMSSDSMSQWYQAIQLNIDDAHPAIMTIILRWCYLLFKNPIAYVIFQNLFFSTVSAFIFNYLHKKGYSNKLLIILSVIIPLIPCIGMNNVTVWKDIVYSISLLLLSFLTYKLIFDIDEFVTSVPNCIALIFSIVFVKNFRHNGLVPFAMIIILFLVLSIKNKNKDLLYITIVSFLVSTFGINILYKSYNVKPIPLFGSVYNSIIKNFGATLYYNDDLSDDIFKKIKPIASKEYFYNNYFYNNIDHYFYSDPEVLSRWFDTVNNYKTFDILNVYAKNIIINPDIFIRDRYDSMDILLSVMTPKTNYPIYPFEDGITFGSQIESDSLKQIINFNENNRYINDSRITRHVFRPYVTKTLTNKYLSAIFWRSGLYFMLYLILIFHCFLMKKQYSLLGLLPIIGNTLSWFIVLNHPSVRYVYYLNMSFIFMLLLLLLPSSSIKKRGVKSV